jgi:hypothetical protein
MAESTAFPKAREVSDTGYQRISGFAIAGFVIGLLFVLFLLIQIVIGFLSHSTVLLPLWLEFFAALGVCLSLIGLRSIRNSDGTLAGVKIAKAGMWISLVAGLGYGSYYGATYLAIRQQADARVMTWFDKLRKGKINEAFLMTQAAEIAKTANPDDEKQMQTRFNTLPANARSTAKGGGLDLFRNNEVIYMIKQGGDATKVVPQGVRSWEHREGVYLLKRVYEVETPEGSFQVLLSAVGRDGADAGKEGRSWHVPFLESSIERDSLKKSKLGMRVDQMRGSAAKFMDEWGKLAISGLLERAYLSTVPPKENIALSMRVFMRWFANSLASYMDLDRGSCVNCIAACTPSDRGALRQVDLPGFEAAFTKAGLLEFSNMTGEDKAAREAVEVALKNMLTHKGASSVAAGLHAIPNCTRRLWSLDAEKRVLLPIDCQIFVGTPGMQARAYADCVAWLQGEPGELDNNVTPKWQLTKIEVLRAGDVADLQAGRQGGMDRFN